MPRTTRLVPDASRPSELKHKVMEDLGRMTVQMGRKVAIVVTRSTLRRTPLMKLVEAYHRRVIEELLMQPMGHAELARAMSTDFFTVHYSTVCRWRQQMNE